MACGLPAVALQGAKGVAKTATARRRADRTVRFDVTQERDAFAAGSFDLAPRRTTLLDECQRPLSLAERGLAEPAVSLSHLFHSDPGPIQAATDVDLDRYVDEIFASGFPGLRAGRFPRDAAATAGTATSSRILDASAAGVSTKPARATTPVYRDVLTRTFVPDPVEPWTLEEGAEHRPASWVETTGVPSRTHLVVQAVLVRAEAAGARVAHLRQQDGRHEIDLVVERGRRVVAFEVKLASTVEDHDVRHLPWLREQLGGRPAVSGVVATGRAARAGCRASRARPGRRPGPRSRRSRRARRRRARHPLRRAGSAGGRWCGGR